MTTDLTHRSSPEAVATWLASRSPVEVDRALVSQALSQGVGLAVRYEGRYPSGQNGERLPSRSVAVGCGSSGSLEAREEAARRVERALTPAVQSRIEEWLAELSVLVPRRQNDEFTERLTLAAYSSRLAGYPADVVREALLGRIWRFWPSWHELHQVCEDLAAPRRQMLAALRQRPVAGTTEAEPRTRVSREEAHRILLEFGFTPKDFAARHSQAAARTEAELMAHEAEAPVPPRTEAADPEGPEMRSWPAPRTTSSSKQPSLETSARDQSAEPDLELNAAARTG